MTCGDSQSGITASASIPSIRSKFLEYSSVYTALPTTPVPVWDLPFASALWNGRAAASGWNLTSDEVQRFFLPSPQHDESDPAAAPEPDCVILLIEDSPADA